jgi:hypothetical protein
MPVAFDPALKHWWIGCDIDIYLLWFKDTRDDDFVNNGTVVATLYDSDGDSVAGAVALPMTYITDSDGKYRGSITDTVSAGLTAEAEYYLEVTGTDSSGNKFVGRLTRTAQYLEFQN